MKQGDKIVLDYKKFTIVEDGYTHNFAINRAQELRRGHKSNLRSHGMSNYKPHLYRVVKLNVNEYGIAWYQRNPTQF